MADARSGIITNPGTYGDDLRGVIGSSGRVRSEGGKNANGG